MASGFSSLTRPGRGHEVVHGAREDALGRLLGEARTAREKLLNWRQAAIGALINGGPSGAVNLEA